MFGINEMQKVCLKRFNVFLSESIFALYSTLTPYDAIIDKAIRIIKAITMLQTSFSIA